MGSLSLLGMGDIGSTLVAALVAGASSSGHCLVMCGPLACAACPNRSPASAASYHGARVAAYAGLGSLAGLLGGGVARALAISVRPALPWVMAAALAASALGLAGRLGSVPGLGRLTRALSRLSHRLPVAARAGVLGGMTPLLPCGLSYGILTAALVAGSAGTGAAVMGGFALGATPALAVAQLPFGLFGPRTRDRQLLARGLTLAAAAMLVFRAVTTGGGATCHPS